MVDQGRKRRRVTKQEHTPEPDIVEAANNNIRQAGTLALTLGTHITFLFSAYGQPVTIHTNLLPEQVKRHLAQMVATVQVFYYFPDHNLKTLQIYQQYLYTTKIACLDETEQIEPNENSDVTETTEWFTLAYAYLFGLEIEDEKFANACVDALIEKVVVEETFPTGLATGIWPYTRGNDRLRRLIVDLHVLMGECTCIEAPHEDSSGPPEFLEAVYERERRVSRNARRQQQEDGSFPWTRDRCWNYHSHKTTATCGNTEDPIQAIMSPPAASAEVLHSTPRGRISTPPTALPSPPTTPNESSDAALPHQRQRGCRCAYSWREERVLLLMVNWTSAKLRLSTHNQWLKDRGYTHQRTAMGLNIHLAMLRKEGATTSILDQERKSWREIQAARKNK